MSERIMYDELWIAYYRDDSSVVVFDAEIEALRYAVGQDMNVTSVPVGVDVVEVARNG